LILDNQVKNDLARPQPTGCGMLPNIIPQPVGCGRRIQSKPDPKLSGVGFLFCLTWADLATTLDVSENEACMNSSSC
jgi:hypothetical protein